MLILTDWMIETPFFHPTCLDNIPIRWGDLDPDTTNIVVSTSDGIAIFGRVVAGATASMELQLPEHYKWIRGDQLLELKKVYPRLRMLQYGE